MKKQEFDLNELPKFEKNFYREHPAVTARSDAEIAKFRADASITVVGKDIPRPVVEFEETNMPDYVLSEVKRAGFKNPTPIQA